MGQHFLAGDLGEDPGGAITEQAVSAKVDLVTAAGGDGTHPLRGKQQPALLGPTSPRTVAETYEGQRTRDIRRARASFETHCHLKEARLARQISTHPGPVVLGAHGDVVLAARVEAPARLR